jgi:NADH-quinone oxidoreductase subunit M
VSIEAVAGMLAWTIYITLLGALAMLALPARASGGPRWLALLASVAGLTLGMVAAVEYARQTDPLVQIVRVAWVPSLGIEYHLAADGISLTLVVLTGLAAVAGVLFSWNIQDRPREFFLLYLTLIAGVYGVFLSFDLFLLFVFYELAIIPKYFLIAIWGSTRREYGAMKLVLYSFVGSAMVLVGILAAGAVASAQTGQMTFSLPALAKVTFPTGFQGWAFPLVFVGFAILAGLWPFHTWAPTGHVAAPTAASMLLAGVVMKLGAYGALRVAVALFPQGLQAWHRELAILAALGILLGALAALAQKDL